MGWDAWVLRVSKDFCAGECCSRSCEGFQSASLLPICIACVRWASLEPAAVLLLAYALSTSVANQLGVLPLCCMQVGWPAGMGRRLAQQPPRL
jgi:hypothetical protein